MTFTVDSHPSGSILAANNTIRAVALPPNTRVPLTYTITVATAPTANATTLAVTILPAPTAGAPLILEDGVVLVFPTDRRITLRSTNPAQPFQTITSGTVSLQTAPIDTPNIPTAASATTNRGLLEMLGVQNMDYNKNTNLISIRSQKSGLFNEQRPVMVSAEFSVSGWLHQRDRCFRNVIQPAANTGNEIYAVVNLSSGQQVEGVFGVSNLTIPIQLDQVMQCNFTLFSQGFPTETYL